MNQADVPNAIGCEWVSVIRNTCLLVVRAIIDPLAAALPDLVVKPGSNPAFLGLN
jgi:hypothetical protein